MAGYIPPVDDMTFLLGEVFDFDAQMAALPGCEEVNTELATSVLEEGGKFCAEVLEPLNRPGDEEGCRLENGLVTHAEGHRRRLQGLCRGRLGRAFRRSGIRRPGPAARAADPARRNAVVGQPLLRPVPGPHPRRGRGDCPPRERRAEAEVPAEDDFGRMDRRHGAHRILGRHRPRTAHHPAQSRSATGLTRSRARRSSSPPATRISAATSFIWCWHAFPMRRRA